MATAWITGNTGDATWIGTRWSDLNLTLTRNQTTGKYTITCSAYVTDPGNYYVWIASSDSQKYSGVTAVKGGNYNSYSGTVSWTGATGTTLGAINYNQTFYLRAQTASGSDIGSRTGTVYYATFHLTDDALKTPHDVSTNNNNNFGCTLTFNPSRAIEGTTITIKPTLLDYYVTPITYTISSKSGTQTSTTFTMPDANVTVQGRAKIKTSRLTIPPLSQGITIKYSDDGGSTYNPISGSANFDVVDGNKHRRTIRLKAEYDGPVGTSNTLKWTSTNVSIGVPIGADTYDWSGQPIQELKEVESPWSIIEFYIPNKDFSFSVEVESKKAVYTYEFYESHDEGQTWHEITKYRSQVIHGSDFTLPSFPSDKPPKIDLKYCPIKNGNTEEILKYYIKKTSTYYPQKWECNEENYDAGQTLPPATQNLSFYNHTLGNNIITEYNLNNISGIEPPIYDPIPQDGIASTDRRVLVLQYYNTEGELIHETPTNVNDPSTLYFYAYEYLKGWSLISDPDKDTPLLGLSDPIGEGQSEVNIYPYAVIRETNDGLGTPAYLRYADTIPNYVPDDETLQGREFIGWLFNGKLITSDFIFSDDNQSISDSQDTIVTTVRLDLAVRPKHTHEYTLDEGIFKVPYKLEVWQDKWDGDSQTWDEYKVVTLSTSDMQYEGRAYDIHYIPNIYGEKQLSFSLYGRFIDSQTSEWVDNYLTQYCFNEGKIKLCYDNEWNDFIIKNVSEAHGEQLSRTYTCQYLPIYELSKTGYTKVFSLDNADGSGIQSATDFMEDILEDSEWQYASADTIPVVKGLKGSFIETNEEIAYSYQVLDGSYTNIEVQDIYITKTTTEVGYTGTFYIPQSALYSTGNIFVGRSDVNNNIETVEASGDLILLKDLVVVNSGTIDWSKISQTPAPYRIQVPKESIVTKWIDYSSASEKISQYCNEAIIDETDEVIYYRRKTATTSNAISYVKTEDQYPLIQYITTYTDYNSALSEGKYTRNDSGYVVRIAVQYNNYYYILDNIPRDCIKGNQEINIYERVVNGVHTWRYLIKGKYIPTLLEGEESEIEGEVFAIVHDLSGEDDNISAGIVNTSNAIFVSALPKVYYRKINSVDGNSYYQAYNDGAIPESLWPKDGSGPSPGIDFYEATLSSKMLYSTSSQVFNVLQFFKIYQDSTQLNKITSIDVLGYYSIVDENNIEPFFYVQDPTGQYYFNKTTLQYTTNKDDNYDELDSLPYRRVYYHPSKSYEMVRTLQAQRSNCFDLTQKVAETFQKWCKYIIEYSEDGHILLDTNGRRRKWVTLTDQAGKQNQVGFTYGFNLQNINRTIKTDNLVTKLFVEYCENDNVSTGYVAIADAEDNISRDNIIYNFEYFIQTGLLKRQEVYSDLYSLPPTDFDPFSVKSFIEGNSEGGGYLYYLRALNEEFIKNESKLIGETSLTQQHKNLQAIISALEFAIGATTVAPGATEDETEVLLLREILINDGENVDSSNYNLTEARNILKKKQEQLALVQGQISAIEAQRVAINNRKIQLERIFNKKYARYIQEGTWSSGDYIDNDAYYYDALKVSNDGAKPNADYNISAIDLYVLPEYSTYKFEVGDISWIEDPEYFGYIEKTLDGQTYRTPYREEVVLTEINYNLDNPTQTTITIKNYSNRFEDLFQSLVATANTFSLNQQMYGRISHISTTGVMENNALSQSLNSASNLAVINNEVVTSDNNGLIVRNALDKNTLVRLASGGLLLSTDGGKTYKTAIYGGQINTELLSAGTINTSKIKFITENGDLVFDGNKMIGIIDTNLGAIAGWILDGDLGPDGRRQFYSGSGNTYVGLCSEDTAEEQTNAAMWAGAEEPEEARFFLKRDGTLILKQSGNNGKTVTLDDTAINTLAGLLGQ